MLKSKRTFRKGLQMGVEKRLKDSGEWLTTTPIQLSINTIKIILFSLIHTALILTRLGKKHESCFINTMAYSSKFEKQFI